MVCRLSSLFCYFPLQPTHRKAFLKSRISSRLRFNFSKYNTYFNESYGGQNWFHCWTNPRSENPVTRSLYGKKLWSIVKRFMLVLSTPRALGSMYVLNWHMSNAVWVAGCWQGPGGLTHLPATANYDTRLAPDPSPTHILAPDVVHHLEPDVVHNLEAVDNSHLPMVTIQQMPITARMK